MMIYLKLIGAYLVIGLFGFGGGYAMLALIERMIVEPGWITEEVFTDIVAVSQMTPGPIGINSATYIGYVAPASAGGLQGPWWGLLGSLVCTVVVVLPSFILVRLVAHWLRRHSDSRQVRAVMTGLRIVVVGLIASAAMLLMNAANFGSEARDVAVSVTICAVAFALTYFAKLHPIAVICLAGIAGFIIY